MNQKLLNGISVIVPVYNSEKYLEKCILSILNQKFTNIEVILVNDGSTDNSLEICEKYKALDNRVKVINQENSGQNQARRNGILNSTFEYVGFVDSDDWIETNMYLEMMNKMMDYSCDCISSGIIHEYESDGNRKEIFDSYADGYYDDLDTDIYPSMLWKKETEEFGLYCNLVNKIFKRDILEKILGEIDYRVIYGEDALVFYSYMMKCGSIYICRKAYYHYRIREGSMCRNMDERLIMNTYYLFKGLEKAFSVNNRSKNNLIKQLKNYILQIDAHILHLMYGVNTNRINKDNNWKIEFYNKKVILYGAGEYGQLIYHYLTCNVECEVVAWVDKKQIDNENITCKIEYPEVIPNREYDIILIGVKSKKIFEEIKKELKDTYNVPDEQMYWEENYMESIYKDVYLG